MKSGYRTEADRKRERARKKATKAAAKANAHKPDEVTRAAVEMLTFGDLSKTQIAAYMKISVPTLTKYYGEELLNGKNKLKAEIINRSVVVALDKHSGTVGRQERHYLLDRLDRQDGNHKTTRVELSGPEGKPIEHRSIDTFSDEELLAIATAGSEGNSETPEGEG